LWAVVVAAGSGSRFGGEVPKQELMLGDRRVVDWSVRTLERWCPSRVVVVVRPDRVAGERFGVAGGATRSASVRAGLAMIGAGGADALVLVHDAARPLVPDRVISDLLRAIDEGADAVVPALPLADTVKRVGPDGRVVETLPRAELVAVQTPQLFRLDALRRAHAGAADATDDAALVEAAGGVVRVVPGDPDLRKVTTVEDLEWLRGRLGAWT
jgi:2-C-methyl-D-erythritol 4-phosphate cytidylyltransferase